MATSGLHIPTQFAYTNVETQLPAESGTPIVYESITDLLPVFEQAILDLDLNFTELGYNSQNPEQKLLEDFMIVMTEYQHRYPQHVQGDLKVANRMRREFMQDMHMALPQLTFIWGGEHGLIERYTFRDNSKGISERDTTNTAERTYSFRTILGSIVRMRKLQTMPYERLKDSELLAQSISVLSEVVASMDDEVGPKTPMQKYIYTIIETLQIDVREIHKKLLNV